MNNQSKGPAILTQDEPENDEQPITAPTSAQNDSQLPVAIT